MLRSEHICRNTFVYMNQFSKHKLFIICICLSEKDGRALRDVTIVPTLACRWKTVKVVCKFMDPFDDRIPLARHHAWVLLGGRMAGNVHTPAK